MTTPLAVATIVGYLLGTLPLAAMVTRRHGIADLRDVGDRNPGFWNAMELIGWRRALPILMGDIGKGAAAAAIGAAVSDRWWAPAVTGGAAMVGHAYPVWSGGRGGRSVATFVGVAPFVTPLAVAVAVAAFLAPVWVVSRRFDRSVRVGVAACPVVALFTDGVSRTAALGLLMTFVGLRFAQATLSDGRRPAIGDPAS